MVTRRVAAGYPRDVAVKPVVAMAKALD